jgi:GDP-L-fucose synthase
MTFWANKRVVVTGGGGFLGSHVVQLLRARGVKDDALVVPRRATTDLRRLEHCHEVVKGADIIIHLAAVVGGIGFNREHPGRLFYENLIMGTQLMRGERPKVCSDRHHLRVPKVCSDPIP